MQWNTVRALAIKVFNSSKANIWPLWKNTEQWLFATVRSKPVTNTDYIILNIPGLVRPPIDLRVIMEFYGATNVRVSRRKTSIKSIKFNVKVANYCRKIRNYSWNFPFRSTFSLTLETGKTRKDQTGKENKDCTRHRKSSLL